MNGKDITPARGVAAFEHLFCRPDPASGELAIPAGPPGLLYGALRSAAGKAGGSATLVHYLNALADDGFGTEALMAELFTALVRRGVLPGEWAAETPTPRAEFLLERIETLLGALGALTGLVAYSELSPAARELFNGLPAGRPELIAALERADDFNRVFRAAGKRVVEGAILPRDQTPWHYQPLSYYDLIRPAGVEPVTIPESAGGPPVQRGAIPPLKPPRKPPHK